MITTVKNSTTGKAISQRINLFQNLRRFKKLKFILFRNQLKIENKREFTRSIPIFKRMRLCDTKDEKKLDYAAKKRGLCLSSRRIKKTVNFILLFRVILKCFIPTDKWIG